MVDFFRPRIKGWVGEVKTQLTQKIFLDSKVYSTFTNLIINDEYGSTQIDHITISKYGIFVVETKNWSGWVYGNKKDKQWTITYPNGRKERTQNPLNQNYRHKMSLSKYLEIDPKKIHSIIMVWGDCRFKTKMPAEVIFGGVSGDTDYIQNFSEVVFADKEVIDICNKIKSGKSEMNLLSGWRHVQSLKQQHDSKNVCPKCGERLGGRLVERNRKQGPFIGCDKFPRCRYTKPLV